MSGCPLSASNFLVCNDDATGCSIGTSQTTAVQLVANQTYHVLVGGYRDTTFVGSGTIVVTQLEPPTSAPTLAPGDTAAPSPRVSFTA